MNLELHKPVIILADRKNVEVESGHENISI